MRLLILLLCALPALAQLPHPTIPNTDGTTFRGMVNDNFGYLQTNKAAIGSCPSNQFQVRTTSGGVVCLQVDWSMVASPGIPDGAYCIVISGGVASLTQTGCPGTGGGGGGGTPANAMTWNSAAMTWNGVTMTWN